ncbi:MAG: hypothetical protein JO273_25760 [Methylobacteriaceae bacterium]|nr:hypothetical protein [Methylobacteriaceae bacterium]
MNSLSQANLAPQQPLVNWRRSGGARIAFHLHDIGTVFYTVGGVYVFCRRVSAGFDPIYVGESDNLWSRLTDNLAAHHAWPSAVNRGVTHISAIRLDDKASRLALETELRHSLNPPCNAQ